MVTLQPNKALWGELGLISILPDVLLGTLSGSVVSEVDSQTRDGGWTDVGPKCACFCSMCYSCRLAHSFNPDLLLCRR